MIEFYRYIYQESIINPSEIGLINQVSVNPNWGTTLQLSKKVFPSPFAALQMASRQMLYQPVGVFRKTHHSFFVFQSPDCLSAI